MITVSDLYVYPIKSCAGTRLESSIVTTTGLQNDRSLMLVGADGRFLTQREFPQLCQVKPQIIGERRLRLTAPGMTEIELQWLTNGKPEPATVWGDHVQVVKQSDEINEWFTEYLKSSVSLVAMHQDFHRSVDQVFAASNEDKVGFADGFSMLLISQASLADLNQRLVAPVPMDRFRPNIVVTGCEAHAEDQWRELTIGSLTMTGAKPCARCAVVSTDQATGERLKEPGATLAEYRRFQNGIMFGMNLVHHATGDLSVGDAVLVGSEHPADWIDRADFC